MSLTPSNMLPLGTAMPSFQLPNTNFGGEFSATELVGKISVVAFICNHCPFVIHLKNKLAEFGKRVQSDGVAVVAISSNDVRTHPQDGPVEMKQDATENGYTFPYLYDKTQDVARAFDAACTPEFYLFDAEGKLAYRGQFDASRPGNNLPVTGEDLLAAVNALVCGKRPNNQQTPSVGCNIKWRQG